VPFVSRSKGIPKGGESIRASGLKPEIAPDTGPCQDQDRDQQYDPPPTAPSPACAARFAMVFIGGAPWGRWSGHRGNIGRVCPRSRRLKRGCKLGLTGWGRFAQNHGNLTKL